MWRHSQLYHKEVSHDFNFTIILIFFILVHFQTSQPEPIHSTSGHETGSENVSLFRQLGDVLRSRLQRQPELPSYSVNLTPNQHNVQNQLNYFHVFVYILLSNLYWCCVQTFSSSVLLICREKLFWILWKKSNDRMHEKVEEISFFRNFMQLAIDFFLMPLF